MLSLPPTTDPTKYTEYTVLQDIPNVRQSEAAPWYGHPGGGVQYELPDIVQNLLDDNILR
jgi:hypothetical protein